MSRRMDREGITDGDVQGALNQLSLWTAQEHAMRLGGSKDQPLFGFSVRDRFDCLNEFRHHMVRFRAWSSLSQARMRAAMNQLGYTNPILHTLRSRFEEKKAMLDSWNKMRACDKPRLP